MKKLLSLALVLAMIFSMAVPTIAAPASTWEGYKEVAITVDTAEDYNAMVALENEGYDYIETRDNGDGTVDVIFFVRNQEQDDYLKGFHYTLIDDASGTQAVAARARARASTATSGPESGLRFEVNEDGWIEGIAIGDGSAAIPYLLPADASVYPDVIFDYSNVSFNETYGFPNRLGYRTVTEYYSEMNYLAKTYPHLVKLHNMGYSWYGRPMYVLEICDKPGVEDGRPEWLHLASTHAREWPANELSLNNAWWFVTEYDKYLNGETDVEQRVINIMEGARTWITPLHNPDGVHWDQTTTGASQRSQRRNRRPGAVPAPFGQTYFGDSEANIAAGSLGAENYLGTDLNRNWAYRWGSSGGSLAWDNAAERTNRGMGPGSEPENVALTGFMRNRMIGSDISGHTSGDLVIFPWSNKKGAAEDTGVMDFVALGRELSSYNVYTDYHERVIYSQSGEGQEYMYGAYRALGFTVEMGQSFKPTYLGVTSGYATASYNDRNPNAGARKVPINYAASTRPTEPETYPMAFLLPPALYSTDGETVIEPAQTTFVPTYSHEGWRTRASYLQAELDADPNFVNGKILICYNVEGSAGNTAHEVAYLAEQNGAKGVLFCTIPATIAGNSSHGFLGAPSINSAAQIEATGSVTIPVGGTFRMYARELLEYTRDGQDWDGNPVENRLTLEADTTRAYNPFSWTWSRNAYMYLQIAEYAMEYAGHIKGAVTDADGNAIPGANLNLTKDVYNTQLGEEAVSVEQSFPTAENQNDTLFWDPQTWTRGSEGPMSTADTQKPDWSDVDWALYAPWGYEDNENLDPALGNHYEDIQAWFKANPPKSRYYDDLVPYENPVTGDIFQTIVEQQTGYMEIQNEDGTFDWSVVPSQQFETYAYEGRNQPNWENPNDSGATNLNQGRGTLFGFEVDSPDDPRIGEYIYIDEGYDVVAQAPGYYHSDVETVFIENYKVVKEDVNFTLQKAIATDFEFTPYLNPAIDIVVPFTTYATDGIAADQSGVTALVNGEAVGLESLGDGEYVATFNLHELGIDFIFNCDLVIDFDGEEHSPLTFSGEDVKNLDDFQIWTDAYHVSQDGYANITTEFVEAIDSNTAILHYYYDTDLFEQKDFHPADGVRVISRETTDYGAKVVVMIHNYDTQTYGRLAIQAISPLSVGWQTVKAVVEYVVRDENGDKEIRYATTTTEFSTKPGPEDEDWVEGDTNGDGVVDLIDLSNMIDWFGIDSSDAMWRDWYSRFDYNNNGEIDIYDISQIAQWIK